MKKLFVTDKWYITEVTGSQVFGCFDQPHNRWHYLNSLGEEIEYKLEGGVNDDELTPAAYFNDPQASEYIGEGFYTFTSHPIEYDMDGEYGVFGIKNSEGNVVVDEQFYEVDTFWHGLCSVRMIDSDWGCIDTSGKPVIPFSYDQPVKFNQYGVSEGNSNLIGRDCKPIEGTALNYIEPYEKNDRYFLIGNFSEEQCAAIDRCGTADRLTLDIFDTKTRKYITRGIPDCSFDVSFIDCELEIIRAAVELLKEYSRVRVKNSGIIFAETDGITTVFDYYQ